jgi:hypothetical protein
MKGLVRPAVAEIASGRVLSPPDSIQRPNLSKPINPERSNFKLIVMQPWRPHGRIPLNVKTIDSVGAVVEGASRSRSTRPWFERFSDLAIACGLIVLLLPLMIVVAVAIRCDSRGPILVWELRRRAPAREFWALKFRCMENEARSDRYSQPEATFVGGILRYLRIDNLPQLVNVLRGELTCLPADPDHQFFLE